MKPTSPPPARRDSAPPLPKAIRRQAAAWLARREAGELTSAGHADLAEWRAADPRHTAAFAEVEAAWRTFDRLAEYPHSDDIAADPDLLRPERPFPRWVTVSALAAAAAVAVVATAWLHPWTTKDTSASAPTTMQFDPHFLRLPDGSSVELNAGSEVEELFSAAERRVRLVRGEAHFTVTRDPDRPFIVAAGGVAVRAVGTAFNVRLASAAVEVIVTEGRVQVNPAAAKPAGAPDTTDEPPPAPPADSGPAPSNATVLSAGQRIVFPALPAVAESSPIVETLKPPEIDRALAWQSTRLVFDGMALVDVVARINRHAAAHGERTRLVVRDAKLGAMRISGRICAEGVDNFVEALVTNFGIATERRADGAIELRRR